VSQHLSVLRRNGLVISWRAGRRVLYRRTDLAASIVGSNAPAVERVAT
jgi:DNA-binding transcriptional ArsR family regulator